ncbi:MAG TPA: pyridoxamine 5'-phosphate oxidase family protein [Candidatus Binatia bacterium]|nr:pyridoxamine 5'-phosphate oxidase family protein [Candidatus Binatia bacterium]
MSLAMTKSEREEFLAGVHVGVLSVARASGTPLTVPIWYAYEAGGDVRIVTGRSSQKFALLERAGRFALCAQTETPPYKYVTVEGPIVAIEPAQVERDERPLAHRYLGREFGDQYIAATGGAESRGSVLIRMRPDRWLSVDYTKQFGG